MSECIHRGGDCRSMGVPGFSQCICGQIFVFIRGQGCSRYKKLEELTDEDRKAIDGEGEREFLEFLREGRCQVSQTEELAAWRRIGGTLQTVLEDSQAFLAQLTQKQRDALEEAYRLLPPKDRYDSMVEFVRRNP